MSVLDNRTRIYLLRHGEVENPRGTFYSQMDVPLSKQGRAQSRKAAEHISRTGTCAEVISSDLSRCRYLAGLVSELTGARTLLTRALREVNFGKWSGLTWKEIEEAYPGEFQRRMDDLAGFRPPGGESLSDVASRVMPVIYAAAERNPGKEIAVVAHGGVNRVVLARLLGMPLDNIFSIDQGYACLNVVDLYADGVAVIAGMNFNITESPRPS